MPTIPLESRAASFGNAIGTGFSEPITKGLDYLIQNRFNQITERQKRSAQKAQRDEELQGLSSLFNKGGYDKDTSALLADLTLRNPQNAFKLLQTLGAGDNVVDAPGIQNLLQNTATASAPEVASPQASLQQILNPESQDARIAPQQDIKKSSFRENLSRGTKEREKKKTQSPAELEHFDALRSQKENLDDLIETTSRMIKTLGTGKVNVGIIPSIKSSLAPTLLDSDTEQFDKDAAHIVNLTSQNIKGVPSRFRVQLIEKEKPGVKHSQKVNRQILERLNKDAKRSLQGLSKQYPTLAETMGEDKSSGMFEDLPPASEYNGKRIVNEATGEILRSNGADWVPVKKGA